MYYATLNGVVFHQTSHGVRSGDLKRSLDYENLAQNECIQAALNAKSRGKCCRQLSVNSDFAFIWELQDQRRNPRSSESPYFFCHLVGEEALEIYMQHIFVIDSEAKSRRPVQEI